MRTTLKCERRGEALVLSLVPPQGKPATLDWDVLNELDRLLDGFDASSGVFYGGTYGGEGAAFAPRLLVLRSVSEKYFCVGANVAVLGENDENTIGDWVCLGHEVFRKLEKAPLPTVAVIEGYAMGGGLELAMACDQIFASETARFGQTEARLGFVTGWGGSLRLPERVGLSTAKRLFYTAELFDGRAAFEMGLVDFVGSAAELVGELAVFEKSISENSRVALAAFKEILNRDLEEGRCRNRDAEAELSVDCVRDEDTKQRVHDFLNTRKTKK